MSLEKHYEVERDRFGVMYSGPLEVGECIEVVPAAEVDRLVNERLSSLADDPPEVMVGAGAQMLAAESYSGGAAKERRRDAVLVLSAALREIS